MQHKQGRVFMTSEVEHIGKFLAQDNESIDKEPTTVNVFSEE